mmetsp:Transcript_19334/g.46199  ORF Transcript_19334/g.46199 Transcript_19334/m.46199 type:complete len:83 (-) Transcript_19334:22-270(-)
MSWFKGDAKERKPNAAELDSEARAEQLRTLQKLFRAKCDEVDDLQESLRMSKTSLEEKAAESERLKLRNAHLEQEACHQDTS